MGSSKLKKTLTVAFLVLAVLGLVFAPLAALAGTPEDVMTVRKIELTATCQKAASQIQQTMREICAKGRSKSCDKLGITLHSVLLSRLQKPGAVGICIFNNYIRVENPKASALIFMYIEDRWDLVEDDFF